MNIRELEDELLLQHLQDAEAEVARCREELVRRQRERYPEVADGVRDATMSAMSTPSMMERNRIR